VKFNINMTFQLHDQFIFFNFCYHIYIYIYDNRKCTQSKVTSDVGWHSQAPAYRDILGVNSPYIINSSIPELHFWTNWMTSSFLNPIVLQSRSLLCISPRLEANQFLCGWWSAQVSDQKISKLFCRMVKVLLYSICPQCPLFHVAKIMKFRWRGKT
jgi:hypothetical protein